jgi:hypothetical protein
MQNFDFSVGADAHGSPQTQVQQQVDVGVDPYNVNHDFEYLILVIRNFP